MTSGKMFGVVAAAVSVLLACQVDAQAEHRVALLIDVSRYDDEQLLRPATKLETIVEALQSYGFRCTQLQDPTGQKLKSAIEDFASSTPNRGTALLYFRGQVLPGNSKGREGTFLVATDAQADNARSIGNTGFAIDELLNAVSSKGGSSQNLVLVDSTGEPPVVDDDLPTDCFCASVSTQKLTASIMNQRELLSAVRAASSVWKASQSSQFVVSGPGSKAVAQPNQFVQGRQAGDEWVNARGMVFCWCPGGTYIAGSPADEPGRYPDEQQRNVVIQDGFWISKYEMTLRENLRNHPHRTIAEHKNHPLTMINHDDAKNMTWRTLSEQERKAGRLPTDWQYSLPTEEQWEYAARAGTASLYNFGDDVSQLPQHANFGDKSYYDTQDIFANSADRTLNDGNARLAIVGCYQPNAWGLFDVHGNVAEWCLDRLGDYDSDPTAPRTGERMVRNTRRTARVVRAGHGGAPAERARASAREGVVGDTREVWLGVRPAALIRP